jgi:transposase-like protein
MFKKTMKPTQLKVTNLAKKHKPNTTWSMEARIQAVSQYLVLGNMALVSATTGIPHQLLRGWKMQPWWKDVEAQVRSTENIQTDTKLTKIVDKSLDAVLDRLENGEFVYDQKTGKIIRREASLRDVAKVGVEFLSKRELLRGNATERKETTQVSVAEQLKELALEFAKWSDKKPKLDVVVDVTDVKEKDEDNSLLLPEDEELLEDDEPEQPV